MPDFVVGQRYPLTAKMAAGILKIGWPFVGGGVDVARGRLFIKPPCTWAVWTTEGRRLTIDHGPGGTIVSESRGPDPDLPPPLE